MADINKNVILPVNVYAESANFVMQGCLPLVRNGQGKIPKELYVSLKKAISAINIALKAIIPNLNIELRTVYEESKGQLIFTSHNLRAFEKLNIKNIICTTINPENRYIRLVGKEKNHNPRDFYIRTITIGGQQEELYDEADLQSIGYAFRRACKGDNDVKISFSEQFRKRLGETSNKEENING